MISKVWKTTGTGTVLLAVLLCSGLAHAAAPSVRILVIDYGDADEIVLRDIPQAVADEVSRKPGYEVIPADELRKAIDDQNTIPFDDCIRAPSCIKRIGRKLQAGHVLTATVKKDGKSYVLTMARTSLSDPKDVQSTSEKMRRLKNMALNVKLCLARVLPGTGESSAPLAPEAPPPATTEAPPPKITVIPDAPAAQDSPAPAAAAETTPASRPTPPAAEDAAAEGQEPATPPKTASTFSVQGFSSPGLPESPAGDKPDTAAAPAGTTEAAEKPVPALPDNPGAVEKGLRDNSIAVLDTVVQSVPATLGALTTQTLSSYAANSLGMDVVSKDDLRKLVSYQQLQQLVGCDGDTCNHATALAQSLGVSRILTSTLGRIGDRFQLSVVAMDTSTGKVIGRATREIQTEEEILENARDLCHFALRHMQRESKGYIRVVVSTTAAQIAIDGQAAGVSPLPTPLRIPAGNHAVHVEKKGFLPFDGAISVEAGKEARVEVTLIAKSVIQLAGGQYLPWAGATAGIALVVGAVSIYGYETALAKCKQYELDSVLCSSPGQQRVPLDSITLASASSYVKFWGNEVGFYGGISSAVVGAASLALFTAYFITGLGAGGDEPPPALVHVDITPAGPVLRF